MNKFIFNTVNKAKSLTMALLILTTFSSAAFAGGNSEAPVGPVNLKAAVYKTVTDNTFKLAFQSDNDANVVIRVRNADNKTIYLKKVKNANQWVENFDFGKLDKGDYQIEFEAGNERVTRFITIG